MSSLDNLLSAAFRFEQKETEASAEFTANCAEFKTWLKDQREAFIACDPQKNSASSKKRASKSDTKKDSSRNSLKENVIIKTEKCENTESGRPRRAAAVEATLIVAEQVNKKLNKKLRQPDTKSHVQVKQENFDSSNNENCKTEDHLMPPPLVRPKRNARKKLAELTDNVSNEFENLSKQIKQEKISETTVATRSTRSKARNNAAVAKKVKSKKDSDVVMKDISITVVELSDSEEDSSSTKEGRKELSEDVNEDTQKQESTNDLNQESDKLSIPEPYEAPTKKARTKKKVISKQEALKSDSSEEKNIAENKKDARKRNVSTSEEELSQTKSTSKRTKPKIKKTKKTVQDETSEYEDATSNNVDEVVSAAVNETVTIVNATVVVTTPKSNLDALRKETFVLNKVANATMVITSPNKEFEQVCPDSLLTEDEDPLPPPKSPFKGAKKPVFSPYTNSPVKQRVEAFEKMANGASNEEYPPTRVTRTKKRNEEKKQQEEERLKEELKLKEKQVLKFFTPTYNNRALPSVTVGNASKFLSATKGQSTERERALKRKEKEEEAQKKKEALLWLKAEQQKKKREEKQQKAQMTREAQEKEKRLNLEREKQEKEAKLEKLLAEKEEKRNKMKEENQRKQLQAKKMLEDKRIADAMQAEYHEKEIERKKAEQEEKRKIAKQQQQSQQKSVEKTPELVDKSKPRPSWASSINLTEQSVIQSYAPQAVVNTLFSCRPMTLDLQEVFPSTSSRNLGRNSSACWTTPPRYTKFFVD